MIPTTNDWLNGLEVTAGNENSGNRNPKSPDLSLDYLIDLLNEGYDRVTWVGSDRDKQANEICQRYDEAQTTWTLESFLNLHSASLSDMIQITGKEKGEYSEEQWEDIISNPSKSLKFARENNFADLPLEIIESIASDLDVSQRFVNQFLNRNDVDKIPQQIVDTTLSDPASMHYIVENFEGQSNVPEEYKDMTRGMSAPTQLVDKGHTFSSGDAVLPFGAPIFSHSHVGCQCFLAVWKSKDPSDVVFVDANGRF